jgi:hypothetical protein
VSRKARAWPFSGLLVALIVGGLTLAFGGSTNSYAVAEPFKMPGPVKRDLLALAKEPLKATLEGRPPRTPKPNPALAISLPLIVSLYVDGVLAARAFQLDSPGPLEQAALSLGAQVLVDPTMGRVLTPEELPLASLGVAVLRDLREVPDDRAINPGEAVVILSGLTQAVGLPSDAPPPKKTVDLLDLTCQLVGLRPKAWLNSQTTILAGEAAEALEK